MNLLHLEVKHLVLNNIDLDSEDIMMTFTCGSIKNSHA
jgi:hypothetical protein